MDKSDKDQVSSLFWLIFAIIFCIYAFKLSLGTLYQAGPGLFPFLAGVALGILSFMNLIKAGRKKALDIKSKYEKKELNWKNIIFTSAILFVFPLLLEYFGFLPATFLFFLVLMRIIQPQKWLTAVGMAGIASFLTFIVFELWLNIKFPTGIFGI